MQHDLQLTLRQLFDQYIEMYATRDPKLTQQFSQNFSGFTGSWGRLIKDHDEWVAITLQDYAQVLGRLRLDVLDLALQQLSDTVAVVCATLHIHLPEHGDFLAKEVTRLVLVFHLESTGWMIAHCSYSIPFHSAQEDEIYPLKSLQQKNRELQALVDERTRQLHESQAFYRMLTEDAEDVHWRIDRNFIITYISPADERLRGFHADQVVGRPVFEVLTAESSVLIREMLSLDLSAEAASDNAEFRRFETQQRCRDGRLLWCEVVAKPDRNEQGEIVGYHGITRNIDEHKKLEQQVQQLAFYDPLTALPNRRLLVDHLHQAMLAGKRSHCYGALLFLDLDNFKPLNDTHGHAFGDLLLIEVAARLKDSVREADTLARVGGDEFVVLLYALDQQKQLSCAQALAVAEKIRLRLAECYRLGLTPEAALIEHWCTASIGVCLFLGREQSLDTVMDKADHAMYQAKEQGRNCIRMAKDE